MTVSGGLAFARFLDLERESSEILQVQPTFLPGLLQTEGYARALHCAITGRTPDDPEVAERVALRLDRAAAFRRRLDSAEPPLLSVVIDEAVLLRHVGGEATMREQIDHLLEALARYPSVRIAVQPLAAGEYAGQAGPFEVVDGGVFFESTEEDRLSTDAEVVERHRRRFESLRAAAETGKTAAERLERISAEFLSATR